MKKILLVLLFTLVFTLSSCKNETTYELTCIVSGGGASLNIVYRYTDDELLSIKMDGEDYEEFAVQEVFFNSRGKDTYIAQVIAENEGLTEQFGVEMSGVCTESKVD